MFSWGKKKANSLTPELREELKEAINNMDGFHHEIITDDQLLEITPIMGSEASFGNLMVFGIQYGDLTVNAAVFPDRQAPDRRVVLKKVCW
jgi:hypothetical protein